MEKAIRKAVIEWDVVTWGRAVDFWEALSVLCSETGGGGKCP